LILRKGGKGNVAPKTTIEFHAHIVYNGKNDTEVFRVKRFRAALKNKSNWPSLVTLALILGCSVFSFWDTKFSEQARSMAFALVAVEFFIMLVVHLEEVKGALKGVDKGVQMKKQEDIQMDQFIADAKTELFFCGWALSWLHRQKLLTMSSKVHVRLLALDLGDDEAKNRCMTTFGRFPGLPTLEHLDWFAAKDNFEIRTTKFPVAVQISARDMRTATGNIQVAFQEYGAVGLDTPCIEFSPSDTAWYDFYKNQIELLWAQGTPWKGPTP